MALKRLTGWRWALLPAALGVISCAWAADTDGAAQLSRWQAVAGTPANAQRGRTFFETRGNGEWSCASCHGMPPTSPGRHASTGKGIEPLAPSVNPARFTDTAKADKWFRRNCNDVLSRECTAAEKADVLAYLLGLAGTQPARKGAP